MSTITLTPTQVNKALSNGITVTKMPIKMNHHLENVLPIKDFHDLESMIVKEYSPYKEGEKLEVLSQTTGSENPPAPTTTIVIVLKVAIVKTQDATADHLWEWVYTLTEVS